MLCSLGGTLERLHVFGYDERAHGIPRDRRSRREAHDAIVLGIPDQRFAREVEIPGAEFRDFYGEPQAFLAGCERDGGGALCGCVLEDEHDAVNAAALVLDGGALSSIGKREPSRRTSSV